MMALPVRKSIRLKNFDYSNNGVYFITVCVKDKSNLFGNIAVGSDDSGAPFVELSSIGKIIMKYVEQIENHYDVLIDKYIIMPNHVHMILHVKNGVPRSSRPTMLIPNIIGAFKKMTNKETGLKMWQTSYHDHIIRNDEDYQNHWQYIDNNPTRWNDDEYFTIEF